MQISMTETFNITAADAVSEGVPVVVSPAIEWLPESWQADVDKVEDVAKIGGYLLSDPHAPEQGLKALEKFHKEGTEIWMKYLNGPPGSHQKK